MVEESGIHDEVEEVVDDDSKEEVDEEKLVAQLQAQSDEVDDSIRRMLSVKSKEDVETVIRIGALSAVSVSIIFRFEFL